MSKVDYMHPLSIEPKIIPAALFMICAGVILLRVFLRIASGQKNKYKFFAIDLGEKYKIPNLLTLISMVLFVGSSILSGIDMLLGPLGIFSTPMAQQIERVLPISCLGISFFLLFLSIFIGWHISAPLKKEGSASAENK